MIGKGGYVRLGTPGWVDVYLSVDADRSGKIKVEFNRDSTYLAAHICAARLPRALPGEAAMIAQAIAAWAKSLTA